MQRLVMLRHQPLRRLLFEQVFGNDIKPSKRNSRNRADANATSWAVRALSVWYLTQRYGKLPAIGAAVVTAVLWTNTDSAHISSSSGLCCRAARARDNAVSLYMGTEANQEVPCRSEGVIILGDLVFRTKQVAPYAKAPSIHPLKSRTE